MATTMQAEPEPMLTIDDVATHLKCSPSKVKQMIAARTIRSVKIGRLRRVPQSALAGYLDSIPAA